MFRAVCLLITFFSAVFAIPALERSPLRWDERIVGGSNAKNGDAPYQVSLRWSIIPSFHFCGASVISSNFILCAAHCTSGRLPGSILAVVGSVLNNPIGKTYKIAKIINHANFDSENIVNDISLLQTAEEIIFGDFVKPVPLTSNTVGGNELAVLTGWGQLNNPGKVPNNLQIIQLRTLTNEDCKAKHLPGNANAVRDSNICTFTKSGEGACMGDSGGPLVVDGEQAGIVSWGIPCGVGYPDAFTRVSFYRDWIKENSGV